MEPCDWPGEKLGFSRLNYKLYLYSCSLSLELVREFSTDMCVCAHLELQNKELVVVLWRLRLALLHNEPSTRWRKHS